MAINNSKTLPAPIRTPQDDPTGRIWSNFYLAQVSGAVGGQNFVDSEIPAGVVDGVNGVFTLSRTPNPTASLQWFWNGQKIEQGVGITLSGKTVTCAAGYIPRPASASNASADTIRATYRY